MTAHAHTCGTRRNPSGGVHYLKKKRLKRGAPVEYFMNYSATPDRAPSFQCLGTKLIATASQYLRNQTLVSVRKGRPRRRSRPRSCSYRGTIACFPCSISICVIWTFVPKSIRVLSSSQRRQNKSGEAPPRHCAGTLAERQITEAPAQRLPSFQLAIIPSLHNLTLFLSLTRVRGELWHLLLFVNRSWRKHRSRKVGLHGHVLIQLSGG